MTIPDDLHEGYRRFRRERYAAESARYRALAAGQSPATMIVGCADSRVDPATILGAAPGELFVVRNVAALVPPYEEHGTYHGTSAALEFAVKGLKVSRVVVLGHGQCGGVAASLAVAEKQPVGRFIAPWVELLSEARAEVLLKIEASHVEARQRALERLAVVQSLSNLASFPFVAAAIADGTLSLEGAWFSIGEGELEWLDGKAGVFEPIAA
jgi:carbonic anhydrase